MIDIIVSVGCIIGSIFIIYASMRLESISSSYVGPWLFPTLIGIALCICGVIILISALLKRRNIKNEFLNFGEFFNIFEVIMVVVLLVVLTPIIGFIPASGVVMFIELFLRKNSLLNSFLTASLLILIIWGLFEKILKVPLPKGPWG